MRFIKGKLQELELQITREKVAQKRILFDDQEKAERIIRCVEKHFNATFEYLRTNKTRPMRAKQVLIYLLREYTGLTNRAIGDMLGMLYPAVSKAGLTMKRLLKEDKHMRHTINRLVSSFQV